MGTEVRRTRVAVTRAAGQADELARRLEAMGCEPVVWPLIAVERLAKDVDPAEEARRAAEFERSREKLRLAQEKMRHDQEVKTKVDAYNLPLVPVESVTSNGGTPGTAPAQP